MSDPGNPTPSVTGTPAGGMGSDDIDPRFGSVGTADESPPATYRAPHKTEVV